MNVANVEMLPIANANVANLSAKALATVDWELVIGTGNTGNSGNI